MTGITRSRFIRKCRGVDFVCIGKKEGKNSLEEIVKDRVASGFKLK
jgi:hypothetical protein